MASKTRYDYKYFYPKTFHFSLPLFHRLLCRAKPSSEQRLLQPVQCKLNRPLRRVQPRLPPSAPKLSTTTTARVATKRRQLTVRLASFSSSNRSSISHKRRHLPFATTTQKCSTPFAAALPKVWIPVTTSNGGWSW